MPVSRIRRHLRLGSSAALAAKAVGVPVRYVNNVMFGKGSERKCLDKFDKDFIRSVVGEISVADLVCLTSRPQSEVIEAIETREPWQEYEREFLLEMLKELSDKLERGPQEIAAEMKRVASVESKQRG